MITRIGLPVLVLLALACSGNTDASPLANPTSEPTVAPEPTETIRESGVVRDRHGNVRLFLGKDLLEKRILEADVIARVSKLSHKVVGTQYPGQTDYVPAIKFIFRAHEYLKGSGGNTLVAYAYGDHHYFDLEESSAREAKDKWGDWILGYRDGRFDSREAIVFLKRPVADGPYQIGNLGEYEELRGNTITRRVTVADEQSQVWLPAASGSSPYLRSPNQRFLTEDVTGGSGGARSGSPSISRSELGTMIASVQDELDANPSDAYRECLIEKYTTIGIIRDQRQRGFQAKEEFEIAAGLPADTQVGDIGASDYFTIGREWLVGRDKDLFTPRNSVIYTARSLAAGEYRFFYNFLKAGEIDCGVSREEERELKVIVTVQ